MWCRQCERHRIAIRQSLLAINRVIQVNSSRVCLSHIGKTFLNANSTVPFEHTCSRIGKGISRHRILKRPTTITAHIMGLMKPLIHPKKLFASQCCHVYELFWLIFRDDSSWRAVSFSPLLLRPIRHSWHLADRAVDWNSLNENAFHKLSFIKVCCGGIQFANYAGGHDRDLARCGECEEGSVRQIRTHSLMVADANPREYNNLVNCALSRVIEWSKVDLSRILSSSAFQIHREIFIFPLVTQQKKPFQFLHASLKATLLPPHTRTKTISS